MADFNAALAHLIADAEDRFVPQRPETLRGCQNAFVALTEPAMIAEAVNLQLRRQLEEPDFVGAWLPNEWVLHRGEFVLTVARLDEPRRYIHALPFHALYAPLSAEGVDYDLYRLPEGHRAEVFDPAARIELQGRQHLAPREPLLIRSDRYVYDFSVRQPVMMLKLMSPLVNTLEWLFSRDRLQAWQANDAEVAYTQLRVAANLLGRFAHQSSLEPLEQLTRHRHHAVRWAAIQALARIYRFAAIDALKRAASDPHPHVQKAARKTLDALAGKA